MGKIYTFINKDHINIKVRTQDLSRYIDEGWSLGNWNQKELNEKSGAGVRKFNDKLKDTGRWEEHNCKRSEKISNTLKEFWQNVSDDYRDNREYKKEQSRNSWTEEERALYHKKMSDSARRNRKTISEEEYKRRSMIANETRKKNRTYATSRYEHIAYDALQCRYSKDDIICQYTDKRYPYKCDFYIKSQDLFIELNIHPSHFDHAYNEKCDSDVKVLNELLQKGDAWSNMIISTWSILDKKKYELAIKNKLNYVTVYPSQFENFISELRSYGNEVQ